MPHTGRTRLLAVIAVMGAGVVGCVTSPATAAREAQQMNDIGDQLNDLRTENATLESLVDSLRIVIAKHDSTLAKLANATGVAVVK